MGSGKDVIQSIGGRDDIEKIAWVLITIIVSVNHFQKKKSDWSANGRAILVCPTGKFPKQTEHLER